MKLTYSQLQADTKALVAKIAQRKHLYDSLFGIPRGGVNVALSLQRHLNLPLVSLAEITPRTLIVDDLIDSGRTLENLIPNLTPSADKYDVAVLYKKPHSPQELITYFVKEVNGWVEFPYEGTATDVEDNVVRILEYLGEDPNREGLKETPKRFVKYLKDFMTPEPFEFTTFDGESYDEMVVQSNIPFFSFCEHHIAPFFGKAAIGYIPDGKIVGLSKLTRALQWHSQRLQNQERITSNVADMLETALSPKGVAIQIKARHLCMEMRGVKTHDTFTTTQRLTGAFYNDPKARDEFLRLGAPE